jgi:16S rRNA (cytosine967-C5)-methyltransferase
MLRRAATILRPGGTLVYCVCSLLPEEGEAQVENLLATTPTLQRQPITAAE